MPTSRPLRRPKAIAHVARSSPGVTLRSVLIGVRLSPVMRDWLRAEAGGGSVSHHVRELLLRNAPKAVRDAEQPHRAAG